MSNRPRSLHKSPSSRNLNHDQPDFSGLRQKAFLVAMHCAALSTGIRLLAKCFSRCSTAVTSQPVPPSTSSSSFPTSIDNLIEAKLDRVDVNVISGVEVYGHDFISETFGRANIKSMETSIGYVDGRNKAAKPVVVASDVACRARGNFLETYNKVLKPIQVMNPIITRKTAEEAELEELVEQVRRMYEELEKCKREPRISGQAPAYAEETIKEHIEEKIGVQPTQEVQCSSVQPRWMETSEVVEIAMRIAHCNDMTIEGVDEVLHKINVRMNTMIIERARSAEEQNNYMDEAMHKMKEYAEVLLDTPCEVQLAIERARVRAMGVRQASDVESIASLAPGSSHVTGCDFSCAESYLPRRFAETEYQDCEPELSIGGSSRSTSPSLESVPSTPRSSSAGLPEDKPIVVVKENSREVTSIEKNLWDISYNKVSNSRGRSDKAANKKFNNGVVVKPVWR